MNAVKLKPLKNKAHKHKYDKVVEWITSPNSPDDIQRCWCFTVMRSCECGTTQKGYSEQSEVEEFIKNATCSGCGSISIGNGHKSQTDCIRELHNKVQFLEDRLEKVCDALSGIGGGR